MGSFTSTIFSGASDVGTDIARSAVEEQREKKKAKAAERKSQLALQQEETALLQKQAQDNQKLLRIGANAQIATSSRGVLGEPIVGRRRLRI